jgi:hypothetical protein
MKIKNIVTVFCWLFMVINCFAQSKNNSEEPIKFVFPINQIYQYSNKDDSLIIVKPYSWDEFNYYNRKDSIPDKIIVQSIFSANIEWVNQTIPMKDAYYKTTLQFVYGDFVYGDNVVNPIYSSEILLFNGKFTSKDLQNSFFIKYNKDEYPGIKIKSKDFLLRNYLKENMISLFGNESKKELARIIIKTYFGSEPDRLSIVSEKIISPMYYSVPW